MNEAILLSHFKRKVTQRSKKLNENVCKTMVIKTNDRATYMRMWFEKNRIHWREYRRKYLKSYRKGKGKESYDNYNRNRLEKDKRIRVAYNAIHHDKYYGKLPKINRCRDCESMKTQAHHHDYSKPRDVIWLCPLHHAAEHKKNILRT